MLKGLCGILSNYFFALSGLTYAGIVVDGLPFVSDNIESASLLGGALTMFVLGIFGVLFFCLSKIGGNE